MRPEHLTVRPLVESDKSAVVTMAIKLGLLKGGKLERENFLKSLPALSWKMTLPVIMSGANQERQANKWKPNEQSITAIPHLPLLAGFARPHRPSLWVLNSVASGKKDTPNTSVSPP
jgi:hypothetical protein